MPETFDVIRKKRENVFVKTLGRVSLETAQEYIQKFYNSRTLIVQNTYSIVSEDETWKIGKARVLDRK